MEMMLCRGIDIWSTNLLLLCWRQVEFRDTSTAAFCIAASNIEKEEKEILKTRKKKGEFSFLQRDPKTLPFFGDQPTLFSSLGSFSQ